MNITIASCCALDVHQATVVACVLIDEGKQRPHKHMRTFRTMNAELQELRNWLTQLGVSHVAMEGTGVYWMPVYTALEGAFDLFVVNARHVKNVPGRKTDASDAEWLAWLLRNGLLRKSFVPAHDIRRLRDLVRYRRMLVQSHTTERNRIHKLLETMGIKLATVASDVFGKSGMAMLHAIAEGETSADALAHLARSRLRQKLADLKLALDVTVQPHHRLLLRSQLQRLARTDADIEALGATIAQHTDPYAEHIALLKTIPGIDDVAAVEIFAEVGADLSSFEHDGRFAAWTGLCPGNNISAGKRLPGKRRRRGNPYLPSILVEASLAATRRKATYLRDKYFRLKARRGPMRALLAIAHKLARAVYRVLTTREPYKDLGPGYLDRRDPHRVSRQLITRLHELGHTLESVTQLFCAVQSRAAAHAAPAPT